MKAIILSVRPEWVAKILNGEKTIEIRKSVPKDFVGWVYIYVTKPKRKYSIGHLIFYSDELYRTPKGTIKFGSSVELMAYDNYDKNNFLCGKVVARFWFDVVSKFWFYKSINDYRYGNMQLKFINTFQKSLQVEYSEIIKYGKGKDLYAWHIKRLEIFDTPKELNEFERRYAPQSWCYVEVKE